MSYFRNVELARKYRISEGTVRNWIKTTRDGKLDLTLHDEDGKSYIANVPNNAKIIEKLVEDHRKYRNTIALKAIEPKPAFYETFSENDIYEIVRNIEAHHEIPRQYNYFDGGADEWDSYTQRMADEETPNLLNRTVQLLHDNRSYLDQQFTAYKYVNVIDIGPGNALPVKALLAHLIEQNKLGRYIAIDISPTMLEITRRNIKQWFGDTVEYEEHILDITHERFGNILAGDYLKKDANERRNLVLFLGGTAHNFRNPDDAFRTIHESMNANDLLIYTERLETEEMRPQWFDYTAKPGKLSLAPIHRLAFDMLNIDDSFYDVEMGFDERLKQRYTRARFTVALTLRFKFAGGERVINLEKGDAILLWRSWQITNQTYMEQYTRNDFYVAHVSQTEDHQYIMAVTQIAQE